MSWAALVYVCTVVAIANANFFVQFKNNNCGKAECPDLTNALLPLDEDGVDGSQSFVTVDKVSSVNFDCPAAEGTISTVALPEGIEITCEKIRVPARWKFYPEIDRTIELAYLRARDTRSGAPTDRLTMYLHGGPATGQTSFGDATVLESFYTRQNGRGDFIVLDERGAGYSVDSRVWDFNGEDLSPAEIWDGLLALGIHPSDYTETDSVRDIHALKLFYGYTQLVVIGNSYGTLLAQHYSAAFPESATGLILDGSVSPFLSSYYQEDFQEAQKRTFQLLSDACIVSEECQEIFDFDPPADFEAYADNIETGLQAVQETDATAEQILLLLDKLISPPEGELGPAVLTRPLVLRLARRYLDGDLQQSEVDAFLAFGTQLARKQHKTVSKLVKQGDPQINTPREARVDLQNLAVVCGFWLGAGLELNRLEEQTNCAGLRERWEHLEPFHITGYLDPAPTLLITGMWDEQTNALETAEIIQTHPRVNNIFLPNAGHCSYHLPNDCVDHIVSKFLADPSQVNKISKGCLSQFPRVIFDKTLPLTEP